MAVSAGTQISYSNYTAGFPEAWRQSGSISIGTSTSTIYIAAPSFVTQFYINHTGLGTSYGKFYVYKWDGTSNTFPSSPWDYWEPVIGIGGSSQTIRMVHNKNNESSNAIDNTDIHLWKVTAQAWTDGWGNTECTLSIWSGGIEVIPNTSTYNYMWKPGSKICCCRGYHFQTSTYSSDSAFISAEKPSAFTGGYITTGVANFCYSKMET